MTLVFRFVRHIGNRLDSKDFPTFAEMNSAHKDVGEFLIGRGYKRRSHYRGHDSSYKGILCCAFVRDTYFREGCLVDNCLYPLSRKDPKTCFQVSFAMSPEDLEGIIHDLTNGLKIPMPHSETFGPYPVRCRGLVKYKGVLEIFSKMRYKEWKDKQKEKGDKEKK